MLVSSRPPLHFYKVVATSPAGEESIPFDTATGNTDSYTDARRCFIAACNSMHSPGISGGLVQLWEDDHVRDEQDYAAYREKQSKGSKRVRLVALITRVTLIVALLRAPVEQGQARQRHEASFGAEEDEGE